MAGGVTFFSRSNAERTRDKFYPLKIGIKGATK